MKKSLILTVAVAIVFALSLNTTFAVDPQIKQIKGGGGVAVLPNMIMACPDVGEADCGMLSGGTNGDVYTYYHNGQEYQVIWDGFMSPHFLERVPGGLGCVKAPSKLEKEIKSTTEKREEPKVMIASFK